MNGIAIPPRPTDSNIEQFNAITGQIQPPTGLLKKIRQDKETHAKYLAWIMSQYSACRGARVKEERKWYMSLAFFAGQQNAITMPVRQGGNGLGTRLYVPPAPYWRARPITNLIRPAVRKEVSTLNSTKPSVSIIPASSDDRDLFAAEAGEQVWESVYRRKKMRSIIRRASWWSVVCGTSYIQSIWDPTAVDEDSDQMGDFCFNYLTPFHILIPDLMSMDIEDQPYVIHLSTMNLETAKIKYGPLIGDVNIIPDTQATADIISDSFLSLVGASNSKRRSVLCIDIWVKPGNSKFLPDGGMITVVGGQIIQAWGCWPYDHKQYPFCKNDYIETGRFYGEGLITDLLPLQREYNRTRGQIMEAKNRMAKPQLAAMKGSIDPAMITTEPGLVVEYNPGYQPPTPIPLVPLPEYVVNELNVIKQDFQDVSGQHDISQGKVPPGVTAATAISFLQEQDDSMRATAFDSLEESLEKLGFQTLSYAVQFWDTQRTIKVVGENQSFDVLTLLGSDLRGNTDIVVEGGSALPMSKSARQSLIMDMMKMGFIDPQDGLRLLEMGGITKFYEDIQTDVSQARRENLKMQAITPQAQSDYLQTFVANDPITGQPLGLYDPNTQQPLQPGQNPPPMVPVNTWDNHAVHIDTHNKFRKGQAFENLDPKIKAIFEEHVNMHLQAAQVDTAVQTGNVPGEPGNPPTGQAQSEVSSMPDGSSPGLNSNPLPIPSQGG